MNTSNASTLITKNSTSTLVPNVGRLEVSVGFCTSDPKELSNKTCIAPTGAKNSYPELCTPDNWKTDGWVSTWELQTSLVTEVHVLANTVLVTVNKSRTYPILWDILSSCGVSRSVVILYALLTICQQIRKIDSGESRFLLSSFCSLMAVWIGPWTGQMRSAYRKYIPFSHYFPATHLNHSRYARWWRSELAHGQGKFRHT